MAYATWNPSDKGASLTLSNGNLSANVATDWQCVRSDLSKSSGKWYWEITLDDIESGWYANIGIATSSASLSAEPGNDAYGWAYLMVNGQKKNNGSASSYGSTCDTNGDIIGVALDLDNGKIWFSKNGTWQNSGDPAAGTGEAFSGLSGTFFAFVGLKNNNDITANFGASSFSYTVPTGFNSGLEDENETVACPPIESTSVIGGIQQIQLPAPSIISASVINVTDIYNGFFIACEPIISQSAIDAGLKITLPLPSIDSVSAILAPPIFQLPIPSIDSVSVFNLVKIWDGAAWKAWVDAYGSKCTKLYYCTLTGSADSQTDLTIPMSSFQARRKSAAPTFLAVVTPGTSLETEIGLRPNGTLEIEMAYVLNGVEEYRETIFTADLDSDGVRIDEGGRNQSITLTGHKTETFIGKVTWLNDVMYKRDDGGDLAFRCASPDLYLNPGDTAKYGSDSFTVNQVVLSISPEYSTTDIEESAT